MHVFSNAVRNGRSRLSKVVDFGTNRKRVCDFILVVNTNLGPILRHFRDIAGFRESDPTPFHPNFRGVPFGLGCRCYGSGERRPYANYSCNYFRTSPTYRVRQIKVIPCCVLLISRQRIRIFRRKFTSLFLIHIYINCPIMLYYHNI